MKLEVKGGWIFKDKKPVFELTEQDIRDRNHFLCQDEKFFIKHVIWHRLAKLSGNICRFCKKCRVPKCEHKDCGGWQWWEWNGKTKEDST